MSDSELIIHASPVAEGARFQIGSATAFAVRKENKDVALRLRREFHPARDAMERIPFLRGISRLVGNTADFLDGVAESAQLMPQQIVKGTRFEQRFAELFRIRSTGMVAVGSGFVILLLAALVIAGPWALVEYGIPYFGWELPRWGINAAACALRVALILLSALIIPHLRIVNRFCMYRGAINQVLNAPKGGDGRVAQAAAEKASPYSRHSDAAFDVTVLTLSVIAFSFIRTYTLPVQLLVRALVLLCVAAVVNEPLRLLENARPGAFVNALLALHLWLERRFVRPPHPQMVETAVYAYNAARENDK